MKTTVLLTLLFLPALPQDFPKLSPFTGVRWKGEVPEVEVGSAWFELVELDGHRAAKIVGFCKDTFGDRWKKRFEEDLVEVLAKMRRDPGARVDMVVKDLATGKTTPKKAVEMTAANRRRIWEAARWRDVSRVSRPHADPVPEALRGLVERFESPLPAAAARLSRAHAEEDLDELEAALENVYSYRDLRGVDFRAALDAVRSSLGDGITRGAFTVQIAKVLALFGDGHTGVTEDPALFMPPGTAPFLVQEAKEGLVAFRDDRAGFVDDAHPFVRMIDGAAVETCLEAAAEIVPKGSAHLVRGEAARNLRHLGYVRAELGLPAAKSLRLELASADGKATVERELELSDRVPRFGTWPRGDSRMLEGSIAYLRIAEMSDDAKFLQDLKRELERFAEARALIVDVRGNGGGSRDALRAIYPFLAEPGAPPRVANVAVYRVPPGEERTRDRKEGFLEDRFLYPLTSGRWTPAERKAIEAFAKGFKPAWTPRPDAFSDWHYFVLGSVDAAAKRTAGRQRKTAVLMDGRCFSATDILLGALKGMPGVTLVGAPSGGGSGRAKALALAHSRIPVRISTMASFRPDGRLYEGSGIEPDVKVEAIATDLIGRTDSVLEEAVRTLR